MIGLHPGAYDLAYDLKHKEFVRILRGSRIPSNCVRILSLKKWGMDTFFSVKREDGLLHHEYWSLPRRFK